MTKILLEEIFFYKLYAFIKKRLQQKIYKQFWLQIKKSFSKIMTIIKAQ